MRVMILPVEVERGAGALIGALATLLGVLEMVHVMAPVKVAPLEVLQWGVEYVPFILVLLIYYFSVKFITVSTIYNL